MASLPALSVFTEEQQNTIRDAFAANDHKTVSFCALFRRMLGV